MVVDCDACRARGPACQDCVVTVLLGSTPDEEVAAGGAGGAPGGSRAPVLVSGPVLPVRGRGRHELDEQERAALAVLAGSGLVPPLRVVPGSGGGPSGGRRGAPGRPATGTG